MFLLKNGYHLFQMLLDYRLRREVVRTRPIRLWIESSSICNLKCVMCPNKDMPAEEKTLMKLDLFKKIIDEAGTFAGDVYLHHRGEPLTNPALFEMIAYANAADLRVRFHTNGTLLDEARADKLLTANPQLVSFSVDGFEKEPYERIRAGANFETTVENICRFATMRRARRLKHPYIVVEKIRFRNPVAPANRDAVQAVRQRFTDAGVDEIIEKDEYLWTQEGNPEPAGPRTCSICTFPWYSMVICADGTVTPCPQDFQGRMKMGDVNRQGLGEIWNGPAYVDLRHKFNTNIDSLPLCHKCDRLHRKTVGGVPFQYMVTFLVDQLLGYGRLRHLMGTAERN
ncbi:MAG: hypothetical protein C0404_02945 [Verrucomicrobia bacterium]|nr:hypothetical protein [Verrucomicrobiota bacterium]